MLHIKCCASYGQSGQVQMGAVKSKYLYFILFYFIQLSPRSVCIYVERQSVKWQTVGGQSIEWQSIGWQFEGSLQDGSLYRTICRQAVSWMAVFRGAVCRRAVESKTGKRVEVGSKIKQCNCFIETLVVGGSEHIQSQVVGCVFCIEFI